MPLFRFPFGNDAKWSIGQDNWDNQGIYTHQKTYAYDFGHAIGGEIRAARAGMVIDAITDVTVNSCDPPVPAGGNGLLIQHCDGTVATYAHLKHGAIKVQVGSWVAQGQLIALSGNTGCSSAPHCHFEVRLSGSSYNALGPAMAIHFENSSGVGWRPRSGDAVILNNTVQRQDGWRWCSKCQGLFFGGLPNAGSAGGICPFDRQPHSQAGSASYILNCQSVGAGSQPGWRWCAKCQGLFFSLNPGSNCPAGGTHLKSGGDYFLTQKVANAAGQENWRYCNKCNGLFFGGTPTAGTPGGKCPADQRKHSGTTSGNYQLELDQSTEVADIYQVGWRYCSKCMGLFFGLHPGSRCPVGGSHSDSGGHYIMIHTSPNAPGQEPWAGPAQSNWRWCSKCQGLFFGGTPNIGPVGGRCPADQGPHAGAGSGDYRLYNNAPPITAGSVATRAPGQDDWRYCSKCLGLFFGGTPSFGSPGGVCPVDKQPHQKAYSGNYTVLIAGD